MPRQTSQIAGLAAKLMAEDGLADYSAAKRKAAAILGLPAGARLPENAEVEAQLRIHRRLFQGDEQRERLAFLRRKAVETMERLARFRPWLSGAALDGSAGRGAEIDIQLFADSAKEVEIFLLNEGIAYRHEPPRSERAEAVLAVEDEGAAVNLVVYPRNEERAAFKTRDGRPRPRARIDTVKKLLEEAEAAE
ncbi:MAG: hypothetical protein LBS70_02085 [Candidatus Accumulibacter sp.]|jgi:hypothetical protein|nr:hypothetical protein [Accumulibacter sp.]